MIRKLILAAVAAAMLVAMAIPAFAQNFDPTAIAANALRQDAANVQVCENQATTNQTGVSQSGLVNQNFGNVTQTSVTAQENRCDQRAAILQFARQEAAAAALNALGDR